jgi:hypothetical protein
MVSGKGVIGREGCYVDDIAVIILELLTAGTRVAFDYYFDP